MFLVVASRALLAPEIALLGLLEVVLGPLWAWLGAGETPAAATLIGGSLVLAALAGNELAAMKPRWASSTLSGKLGYNRARAFCHAYIRLALQSFTRSALGRAITS